MLVFDSDAETPPETPLESTDMLPEILIPEPLKVKMSFSVYVSYGPLKNRIVPGLIPYIQRDSTVSCDDAVISN